MTSTPPRERDVSMLRMLVNRVRNRTRARKTVVGLLLALAAARQDTAWSAARS